MSYREALGRVSSRWLNTMQWSAIVLPPLVAFNDNVASLQIVAGQSMSPTLNPDPASPFLDVVWVSKVSNFSKGDIILLTDPIREERTRIIKRVAEISHDGSSVFVLGDNAAHSTDSRQFGRIPSVMVEGVVQAVVFPPWRWRSLSNA